MLVTTINKKAIMLAHRFGERPNKPLSAGGFSAPRELPELPQRMSHRQRFIIFASASRVMLLICENRSIDGPQRAPKTNGFHLHQNDGSAEFHGAFAYAPAVAFHSGP